MAANPPRTCARVEGARAAVTVSRLGRSERGEALARLGRDARHNLFLIDLVRRVGRPALPGEFSAEVLLARRGERLIGIASRRPTIVLEAKLEREALDALLEPLSEASTGLVRSPVALVAPLWRRLAQRGRHRLVDRTETAFLAEPASVPRVSPPPGARLRAARASDLEALVAAARASLREEGRPDPFEGDPRGFRRWVQARRTRALVGETAGQIAFVGYADVRLPEGWLLQGVYTWPEWRRQGLASAGISHFCAAAHGAGAEHVQLSVVEGNRGAEQLYERLNFQALARLRTLLFV